MFFRIIFAGFPATTVFDGISLVTTDPAPTMTSSPILTPGKIIALTAMKQFFPIYVCVKNG